MEDGKQHLPSSRCSRRRGTWSLPGNTLGLYAEMFVTKLDFFGPESGFATEADSGKPVQPEWTWVIPVPCLTR